MTRNDAERQEAREDLLKWLKPGDTVYTVLDHVSRSGMSRAIRVLVPCTRWVCNDCGKSFDMTYAPRVCEEGCGGQTFRAQVDHIHPNWAVGKLLGLRHWRRGGREQDALVVGGCGMDMGFHLVYELSHRLFHEGYPCLGQGKCPSNYHVNHRERVRCEGFEGRFCYKPDPYSSRFPVPDGWPTRDHVVTVPSDNGAEPVSFTQKVLLACLTSDDDTVEVCPTCQGEGDLPNSAGPERFDLVHTDGYALKQRWL